MAQEALASLCRTYWYPLYAHVRRRGYSPHDAEDLTQEFFVRLLARDRFGAVRPDKGKFRSFLLSALNHFLIDEWKKVLTQKRGGGQIVSWDSTAAETRYGQEPFEPIAPEQSFERNWALALLDSVYEQLQREYEASGKRGLFEALKFCLSGERSSIPYTRLAARLNVSEGAVKTMVHRLRARYREVLRAEVGHTVANPAEIEEELRALLRALASR